MMSDFDRIVIIHPHRTTKAKPFSFFDHKILAINNTSYVVFSLLRILYDREERNEEKQIRRKNWRKFKKEPKNSNCTKIIDQIKYSNNRNED